MANIQGTAEYSYSRHPLFIDELKKYKLEMTVLSIEAFAKIEGDSIDYAVKKVAEEMKKRQE